MVFALGLVGFLVLSADAFAPSYNSPRRWLTSPRSVASDRSSPRSVASGTANALKGALLLDANSSTTPITRIETKPNASNYTDMIKSCVRDSVKALAILRNMPNEGAKPNSFDYYNVLGVCAQDGKWELALSLMQEMSDLGFPPKSGCFNVAISACINGKNPIMAHTLLSDLIESGGKVQDRICSRVLVVLQRGHYYNQTLQLFDKMLARPANRINLDTISFNVAIDAAGKLLMWEKSLELLNMMPSKGAPRDIISYNSAAAALERGGRWNESLTLMMEMQKQGIKPDAYTCNSVISACARGGQPERAVKLLVWVDNVGLADDISFSSAMRYPLLPLIGSPHDTFSEHFFFFFFFRTFIIRACEVAERLGDALKLLAYMDKKGRAPTLQVYKSISRLCERQGKWEEARAVLDGIHARGEVAPSLVYNAAMGAVETAGGPWQATLELFDMMRERAVSPGAMAYSAALKACERGGNADRALALIAEMKALAHPVSPEAYGAVIKACTDAGRLEEAVRLKRDLEQQ